MGRPPNDLKTVTLKISTTEAVIGYLDRLVRVGIYGKNRSEAAERLVSRGLQEIFSSELGKNKEPL